MKELVKKLLLELKQEHRLIDSSLGTANLEGLPGMIEKDLTKYIKRDPVEMIIYIKKKKEIDIIIHFIASVKLLLKKRIQNEP